MKKSNETKVTLPVDVTFAAPTSIWLNAICRLIEALGALRMVDSETSNRTCVKYLINGLILCVSPTPKGGKKVSIIQHHLTH